MTSTGSLRLLVIFGFFCSLGKSEVIGVEDVCQGNNVHHLVAFLEQERVEKVGVSLLIKYYYFC
jgi:hypothetical protein